jgi:hypothetical protein
MRTTSPRKALHAYVTAGCHDAFHGTASAGGVSVSAMLEAIGEFVADLFDEDHDAGKDQLLRAREIDASRRRRNQHT